MSKQKYLKFTNYLSTKYNPKKNLLIGTDCSGTEAPIQALEFLNVDYKHLFSSDNDEHVKTNVLHNFKPKIFYDNITTRNHSKLPKLDVYVCGFPCQSFSILGKRQGFDDEIKGTIFFDCFLTIKHTKPTVFILENVKGLLNHDKHQTFKIILECLQSLKQYNIYYQVLNTKDFGLPQNRERIYIIGINKNKDKNFKFPEPIPLEIGVTDLLDKKIDPQYKDYLYNSLTEHKLDILSELIDINKIDNLQKPWLVNLNVSTAKRTSPMLNISPTLLAGNGDGCIYFLTSHERLLTPNEYQKLQGFHPNFESIVDRKQTYKQAGNAMSVNVLCFLFMNIFKYVNF